MLKLHVAIAQFLFNFVLMKYSKTSNKSQKKKLTKKLLHKYRLVILNEDTFEERFAMKLTRLNVFIFGSLFALLLIGFTTIFIAFTPIREYIPGYTSPTLQKQAIDLEKKTGLDENDEIFL